jgi:hypothetical protein
MECPVRDFLKANKEKFEVMMEVLDLAWESCVIPSMKAYSHQRARNEILPANHFVKQEWLVSIAGIIAILLKMAIIRKDNSERDKSKALLASILAELTFIEQWTFEFFMAYLDDSRTECGDSRGDSFCYHVKHDLDEWMASARIACKRQKMFPSSRLCEN